MKYLLLFLFCLALQPAFAQDENRHAATQTPEDIAVVAARRFEGRLNRLREALEKNDASSIASCSANLLGDIRSAIDYEAQKSPESKKLAAMQAIFEKIENTPYDPAKPVDLKASLAPFEEFLKLLQEK